MQNSILDLKKLVLGYFHPSSPTLLFYEHSFSLHHDFQWYSVPASNIAVATSQFWEIVLFHVTHKFNICFTKGEHILYDITASLSLFSLKLLKILFNFYIALEIYITGCLFLYGNWIHWGWFSNIFGMLFNLLIQWCIRFLSKYLCVCLDIFLFSLVGPSEACISENLSLLLFW